MGLGRKCAQRSEGDLELPTSHSRGFLSLVLKCWAILENFEKCLRIQLVMKGQCLVIGCLTVNFTDVLKKIIRKMGYNELVLCLFHSLITGLIGFLLFRWYDRLWSIRAGNDRDKGLLSATPLHSNGNREVGTKLFGFFFHSFSSLSDGWVFVTVKSVEEAPFVVQLVKTWVPVESLGFRELGR